jgi:hypothetical protein
MKTPPTCPECKWPISGNASHCPICEPSKNKPTRLSMIVWPNYREDERDDE